MTTVGEADLVTALDRNLLVSLDLVAEHVAHLHLVLQRDNQVKTAWVEGQCQAFLSESGSELMSLGNIVPDVDRFIARACGNELFPDADIESCNFSSMEWPKYVIELFIKVARALLVVGQVDFGCDHLTMRRDCVDFTLIFIRYQRDDAWRL